MISTPRILRCGFAQAGCGAGHGLAAREQLRRALAPRRLFTILGTLVVLAAPWWHTLLARAQQAEPAVSVPKEHVPNEYAVKALCLYSFGRYIEWPENTFRSESDPFVIGIVGQDPIGRALDDIAAKKTIQERPIVVRRFASASQYKQPCQILFVSRSLPPGQQAALIRIARGTAMLVVGETPGFAENGGGANLVVDGGQVRFEINVVTARRSRLHMDAKLLNLGKPVGAPRTADSK